MLQRTKCKPIHSEWKRFSDVNPIYRNIHYIGGPIKPISYLAPQCICLSLSLLSTVYLYRYNEKGCNDNSKKIKAPWL